MKIASYDVTTLSYDVITLSYDVITLSYDVTSVSTITAPCTPGALLVVPTVELVVMSSPSATPSTAGRTTIGNMPVAVSAGSIASNDGHSF